MSFELGFYVETNAIDADNAAGRIEYALNDLLAGLFNEPPYVYVTVRPEGN